MEYDDFVNEVISKVESNLKNENAAVEIRSIVKMNDCIKDGITIRDKNNGKMMPTVYLNDFYGYLNEGYSVDDIAVRIAEILETGSDPLSLDFIKMMEFEKAKNNITMRVMNTAANRRYLEDTPHIEYLDLSLVFYLTIVTDDGNGLMSTKINDILLKEWGVSAESLYKLAMDNTENLLGIYLQELRDACIQMLESGEEDFGKEFIEAVNDESRIPMYLLTNNAKCSGAVTMFLGNTLEKISDELNDDIYIIPSSVHEVLLIPAGPEISRKEVDNMVREVNSSALEEQDILSDHVYIYSRKEKKIIM